MPPKFVFDKSLQLLVITQIIETLAIVCGSIKFSFVEAIVLQQER